MKRNIFSLIEDSLFPPRCAGCGDSVWTNACPLCATCVSSIPVHSSFFCPACKNRIPLQGQACHFGKNYILGAATDFNNPIVQNIIHSLKYENLQRIALPIGEILAHYISAQRNFLLSGAQVIIPVPLHKKKRRARGYNQAELLASMFIKRAGLSANMLKKNILIKTKETPSQTTCVTVQERRNNIAESFEISDASIIKDKNIVVIDDVHTTGSTMNEIARVLKKNGAKSLLALVFAKT